MRVLTAVLVVALISLAACGGDDGDEPASPTAGTPGTAVASPTQGTIAKLAPGDQAARTPAGSLPAAELGRTDCAADWLAFETTLFSICYPPDLFAELISTPAFPNVLSIRLVPGPPLSAAPHTVSVWASTATTEPKVAACAFEGEEGAELDDQVIERVDLGLITAETCTASLLGQTQYYGVAATGRGAIAFKSQGGSDEQLVLAKEILATLRGEMS